MVAPIETQAGEIPEKLKEFAAELGFPLRGDGNNPRSLRLPNGSRIVARSAVARSVRGFSKASLIIIDEAAFVNAAAYRALSPCLAVSKGHLWALSTPYGHNNLFAEIWHDRQADWTRFEFRATDCPRLTPEFLASERRLHDERSYAQEYDCRSISHGLQLLTREQVTAALINQVPAPVLGLWEKAERYYGFAGRPGYKFVGVVEDADSGSWVGKRVVRPRAGVALPGADGTRDCPASGSLRRVADAARREPRRGAGAWE
jgi:hypothetical protein